MLDLDKPLTAKLTAAQEASVRAKVLAKLEHYLPAATDTVLCDYVMVMVGNKKTSGQIMNELDVRIVFLQ
jgi:hypothetical protein